MPLPHYIKFAVVALSMFTLTACGGGGDVLSPSASPESVVSSANFVFSSLANSSEASAPVISSSVSRLSSSSLVLTSATQSSVASSQSTGIVVSSENIKSSTSSVVFSSQMSSVSVSSINPPIDSTAPTVSIMFPASISATNGDSILVRGTAKDDLSHVASVKVNGQLATTSDEFSNWQVRVPLTFDENKLIVSVADSAGNYTDQVQSLIVVRNYFFASNVFAVDEVSNRALLMNSKSHALEAINLTTAAKTVISDLSTLNAQTSATDPVGLVIDKKHNRGLILDKKLDALIAIDLNTGVHNTLVRDNTMPFVSPVSMVLDEKSGRVLVHDNSQSSIISIDLVTGARSILTPYIFSACDFALNAKAESIVLLQCIYSDISSLSLSGEGSGGTISNNHNPNNINPFKKPKSITVDDEHQKAFVTDDNNTIIAVDLSTGERSLLSDIANESSKISYSYNAKMALNVKNNRLLMLSDNKIISVDLTTGKRHVLYGAEGLRSITPSLWNPESIVIDKTYNRGLIVDSYFKTIVAVDLTSGERSVFSSIDVPNSENNFQYPIDIKLDPEKNRAIILDQGSASFIEVDLKTGNRNLLAKMSNAPNAGSFNADGFSLDLINNRAYAVGISGVAKVDLNTGAWSLLSGVNTLDNINPIGWPHDIALDMNNNRALIVDNARHSLMAINLESGARTVISDDNTSLVNTIYSYKDQFYNPYGISFDEKNNRALVADKGIPALISVNLADGIRTIISGNYIPNNINQLRYPVRLTADYSRGVAFVVAQDSSSIVLVDLVTGERVIFAQ